MFKKKGWRVVGEREIKRVGEVDQYNSEALVYEQEENPEVITTPPISHVELSTNYRKVICRISTLDKI